MSVENQFPPGVNVASFVNGVVDHKTAGAPYPSMTLDEMFIGAGNDRIRNSIQAEGVAEIEMRNGHKQHIAVDVDEYGNVLAVAAAVPRTPGRADDFLRQVADFTEQTTERKEEMALYNRIYEAEGLVNNATNKVSSLAATSGGFKVRRVAGKPGKSGDKRAQELILLLQYWAENVNANGEDAVITGGQGVQDFMSMGTRQALIEGDIVAQTYWTKVKVPQLGNKAFSLPMNMQAFGGAEIEIPKETTGTPVELIYWVPPADLVNVLKGQGKDKNVKKLLDKYIPKEMQSQIKKDGKALLDPSLMIHIKHRGVQNKPYGESFVRSAMSSVAYKRALQALDVVTIENLVNRMLVFKIGSDDKDSAYHTQAVSQRRAITLQNLLRRIGPSATIVWAGPDLEAVDIGAHSQVMSIDSRLELVRGMMREDMGVPSALLTGEGNDGKSSGLAATSGVAAQITEIQNRWGNAMRTIGMRIAVENGYDDVDLYWEFNQVVLADKSETVDKLQKGYAEGNVSTRTLITDGYGLDYEAEEGRQLEDVAKGYKEEAFGPPKAVMTINAAGTQNGGGGKGRPPGGKDPRKGKETGSKTENK